MRPPQVRNEASLRIPAPPVCPGGVVQRQRRDVPRPGSAEGGRARGVHPGKAGAESAGSRCGRPLLWLDELDDQELRGYAEHSRYRRAAVRLGEPAQPVARRSCLRPGEAAGCEDEALRAHLAAVDEDGIDSSCRRLQPGRPGGREQAANGRRASDLDPSSGHVANEDVEHGSRALRPGKGAVLGFHDHPEPVASKHLDELGRAEAGEEAMEEPAPLSVHLDEHRAAELRVRHIAASAAGDEELAAELRILFEEGHPCAALRRPRGRHHPCRPAADDAHIRLEIHAQG